MLNLLGTLRRLPSDDWVESIREAISDSRTGYLFSEYELYFDYVRTAYPDLYEVKHLPWLRIGNMCTRIELFAATKVYYFIAYEYSHLHRSSLREIYSRWRRMAGVFRRTSRVRQGKTITYRKFGT